MIKIANNYAGYGLSIADLIQEGSIGLMKAVKRFRPEVGVRLVSFAVHWIKAEIHEFILKNWRIVKVATTKAQRKLFFKLRSQKTRLGWFKSEEIDHVAETLGVTRENVIEMENRLNNYDRRFRSCYRRRRRQRLPRARQFADVKYSVARVCVTGAGYTRKATMRCSAQPCKTSMIAARQS